MDSDLMLETIDEERDGVAAQLSLDFEDFLPPGMPVHWHGGTTGPSMPSSSGGTGS